MREVTQCQWLTSRHGQESGGNYEEFELKMNMDMGSNRDT